MKSKKQLYESIMRSISVEVKRAIDDAECNAILEEYGLSYIFALNEDDSNNIFQKFKKPLADALNKVKSKFGDKPCKAVADIVKKAQSKGRKTLYGVLTAVTLLSSTLSAGARTTSDFDVNLRDSVVKSTVNMGKAQGLESEREWERAKDAAVKEFTNILYTLEIDNDNRYGACGVGCSESQSEAQRMAQQDVEKTLKEKYGENAVKDYGIQFKTVQNKSYTQTLIANGKYKTTAFYTVIVVAYQAID